MRGLRGGTGRLASSSIKACLPTKARTTASEPCPEPYSETPELHPRGQVQQRSLHLIRATLAEHSGRTQHGRFDTRHPDVPRSQRARRRRPQLNHPRRQWRRRLRGAEPRGRERAGRREDRPLRPALAEPRRRRRARGARGRPDGVGGRAAAGRRLRPGSNTRRGDARELRGRRGGGARRRGGRARAADAGRGQGLGFGAARVVGRRRGGLVAGLGAAAARARRLRDAV